jgi:TatD family-associated radical SAM protein
LIKEVQHALDNLKEPPDAIVIAGEGEPTLRLEALLELSRACSKMTTNADIPVRVTTNGLAREPKSCASKMKSNGVEAVSVSLMTADATQYDELMQPMLAETGDRDFSAHGRVCEFIREAVISELQVEVTGVDRPEVNKDAAERLADSLGVTKPFRWRPYFS